MRIQNKQYVGNKLKILFVGFCVLIFISKDIMALEAIDSKFSKRLEKKLENLINDSMDFSDMKKQYK